MFIMPHSICPSRSQCIRKIALLFIGLISGVLSIHAADSLFVGDTIVKAIPLLDSTTASLRDSLAKKYVSIPNQENPLIVKDSNFLMPHRLYWGGGAGWALGSQEIFALWLKGMPRSLIASVGDTTHLSRLKFSIKQPAPSYNSVFPVSFGVGWMPDSIHWISIETSLRSMRKEDQTRLSLDSTSSYAIMSQSLWQTAFSIGFTWRRCIPEEFFSINNVERSAFLVGLNVEPLNFLSLNKEMARTGNDSLLLYGTNTALDHTKTFSSFGVGLSWRIGICAVQAWSTSSGIELCALYLGNYCGYYFDHDRRIIRGDLYADDPKAYSPLSGVSHQLLVYCTLLKTKKRPTPPLPASNPLMPVIPDSTRIPAVSVDSLHNTPLIMPDTLKALE